MLIAGNVSKDVRTRTLRVYSGFYAQQSQDAVIIAEMVEAILASSPLSSQLFDRALILPEGLFPILNFCNSPKSLSTKDPILYGKPNYQTQLKPIPR